MRRNNARNNAIRWYGKAINDPLTKDDYDLERVLSELVGQAWVSGAGFAEIAGILRTDMWNMVYRLLGRSRLISTKGVAGRPSTNLKRAIEALPKPVAARFGRAKITYRQWCNAHGISPFDLTDKWREIREEKIELRTEAATNDARVLCGLKGKQRPNKFAGKGRMLDYLGGVYLIEVKDAQIVKAVPDRNEILVASGTGSVEALLTLMGKARFAVMIERLYQGLSGDYLPIEEILKGRGDARSGFQRQADAVADEYGFGDDDFGSYGDEGFSDWV